MGLVLCLPALLSAQTAIFSDDFECGDTSAWSAPNSESASMAGMTCAHNDARDSVIPAASPPIPPLSWDNNLAAIAQAWANNCTWAHSGNGYGENLAAFVADETPQAIVDLWVLESACYDYATNTCSPGCIPNVVSCGHYTQVVWRTSARIGCGVRYCTTGSPFPSFPNWYLWVCNYDPPGNFIGQKPY
ncbi:MAG: CAP domain-containing protein [Thermoanaerobaculales bacterium]